MQIEEADLHGRFSNPVRASPEQEIDEKRGRLAVVADEVRPEYVDYI